MTKNQRIHLMADCWKPACQTQGWKVSDRAFRLTKFSALLGRELKTSDDIEPIAEYSRLKMELLQLANRVAVGDPKKKNLLWVIQNQLRPCLALYVDRPDDYIARLLKERHKVFRGVSSMEDLSTQARPGKKHSELMMFIFTLADRIDAMRRAAGDTGHEMCVRAEVKCKCADCAKGATG